MGKALALTILGWVISFLLLSSAWEAWEHLYKKLKKKQACAHWYLRSLGLLLYRDSGKTCRRRKREAQKPTTKMRQRGDGLL